MGHALLTRHSGSPGRSRFAGRAAGSWSAVAAALALSLAGQGAGAARPTPPSGHAVVCHVDHGGQTQRIVVEPVHRALSSA